MASSRSLQVRLTAARSLGAWGVSCACALVLWLAPVTACQAQPQDTAECGSILEAYARVETLYASGSYEAAADLLRAARRLCPSESLLAYNLGRALDRRAAQLRGEGDAALADARAREAIAAYGSFIAGSEGRSEDAEVVARARERLGALQAELDARARARREAEERASVPVPTCTGESSPVPWIVAGIGGLAIGVSIGLAVHAVSLRDAADREPIHQDAIARFAEAQDWATAANATLGTGAGLGVLGIVWGIVDVVLASSPRPCGDEGASAGPTIRVPLRATGLGLELRF